MTAKEIWESTAQTYYQVNNFFESLSIESRNCPSSSRGEEPWELVFCIAKHVGRIRTQ